MKESKKGFSLVELMTVVLIAAVLMGIAIPMWQRSRDRANANACTANLEIIKSATREWALDNPGTTGPYQILAADVNSYIDGELASLDEPDGGNYILPLMDAGGNIPDPTCSTGTAGHAL